MKGRIYLIGMPGSGKSYFSRELSAHFDIPIVDLDKEIERVEEASIPEIFATKGEDYFRETEARLLRFVSEQYEDVVISTGGGTPCFHDGIDYMNQMGITVFLETDRELLLERISKKSNRPLMEGNAKKKIDELLEKRMPVYQQASLVISHRDPDQFLAQILSLKS